MKKIFKYFVLIVILSITACNEDLLNVTNPNLPTKDTFWKTTDDLQLALTATYSKFTRPGKWGRWIYFRYDLTSDEGFSNTPWTELKNWTNFIYTNYNFIWYYFELWFTLMVVVRREDMSVVSNNNCPF